MGQLTEEHKKKLAEGRKKAKEEGGIVKQFNPIIKAKENPTSKALAIKAMCAHCMGCTEDSLESGWREEVRKCSAPQCPLHPHRPFK